MSAKLFHFFKANCTEYSYVLECQELVRVENVNDLGVMFDSSLSFEAHIEYIINKAS